MQQSRLDALRWGREDLHLLISHGEQRVMVMLQKQGVQWPDA
jgi:hypothetical protein